VVRNRLRGRRLAVLSHELRTPLNVILGWTQLLQRQRDTAAMERGLLVIDRNARLQAQLIEDLLDMSRIVSRTLRLELNELDPSELIHEQLEAMRPAAHAKAITLTMNAQAGIGRIRADRARLQQVLGNMLTNPLADR
jgi:signal transduction histidine kinase